MADNTVIPKGKREEGLGKKISSFLLKALITEKEVMVPKVAVPKPPPAAVPAVPTSAPAQELAPALKSGIIDEELKKGLLAEIEKNNIEGYDFYEFNDLLEGETALRMQDKYVNAYNALRRLSKKDPTIKKTLIESAKKYMDILSGEKDAFEVSLQGLMEERVGSKRTTYDALASEVSDLEAQRQKLDLQIKEKQVAMASLEDEMSAQNIELSRKRLNFLATIDSIINDIRTKSENIEQYIPADPTPETTKN